MIVPYLAMLAIFYLALQKNQHGIPSQCLNFSKIDFDQHEYLIRFTVFM